MKKSQSLNLLATALTLAAVLSSASTAAQTVATVATGGKIINVTIDGNGNWGATETVAPDVAYSYGVDYDGHGNLFFCNTPAGTIDKLYRIDLIQTNWHPTTVVSNLNYPSGFAINVDGSFIYADYGSGCFNQILGGVATPIFCGIDGPVSVRRYNLPMPDPSELASFFYALTHRGGSPGGVNLVRRNPDGTWTNLQTIATGLSLAYDAVSDRAGNLFVSELGNNRILEYPALSDGTISTNPVVFATNLSPVGLVFDYTGNLYEADFGGTINKFVLTNGTLNPAPIAVMTQLNQPTYIAFPPRPVVRLRRAGSNVVLTWPDALYALQSTDALTGTFAPVTGATSPYTNAIAAGIKFFRLKTK